MSWNVVSETDSNKGSRPESILVFGERGQKSEKKIYEFNGKGELVVEKKEAKTEDEIPENPSPVAKLGDLWALGDHRLMCGDSVKKDNIKKLINGKKIDIAFCDPPYNIGHKYESYSDNKSKIEYKIWCKEWFNNLKNIPIKIFTVGKWNLQMWYEIEKPLGTAI